MPKGKIKPVLSTAPLPTLPSVTEIQKRLGAIFPESYPDRGILVGTMAARVVFVFLYGGFVEGQGRYLRPSNVYLFTQDQATQAADSERLAWLAVCNRPGYRMPGTRWYADTSRESIRDDFMRNQLLRIGVMQKLPGHPVTSSQPINFLARDFAALFDPALTGTALETAVGAWQSKHLSAASLQRMALKAHGVEAKTGDVFIDLPDGTRIRVSAGLSSEIAKGLIEKFATKHLTSPTLLWLSTSDKKAGSQFVEAAATVGLKFDVKQELPDVILADMQDPVKFFFCEIVASDGAMTEGRKDAFLAIVRGSGISPNTVEFLTAFDDRNAPQFRKNFSQLAVNSLVWFRTEPDLLVILTTVNRAELDPNAA